MPYISKKAFIKLLDDTWPKHENTFKHFEPHKWQDNKKVDNPDGDAQKYEEGKKAAQTALYQEVYEHMVANKLKFSPKLTSLPLSPETCAELGFWWTNG